MDDPTVMERFLSELQNEMEEDLTNLLLSFEERIANCRIEDDDGDERTLYNEDDLAIDLYTITEEYTDRIISQFLLMIEEKLTDTYSIGLKVDEE